MLDNCIGSGTTAIACVNTCRNFVGIEKEKKYCDIARKRIKAAGKKRDMRLITDDELPENKVYKGLL